MRKIVGEKKKTQRNRFTRMCMGDALVNIMQQKAYDKISVSDIVKKAGVSRMTYYNYYETKEELVKDYIEEITSLYLEEEKNNLKENKHEDMTVEVDGNISPIKAQELKKYGASIYVAGTTALFKGDVDDFSDNIRKLRSVI